MFNSDTEILFPIRVIPSLRDLRGAEWQQLVDNVTLQPDDSVAKIAFTALIVSLGGCGTCNADSYRAMRGCTQCSRITVKRFKGSDHELVELYEQMKTSVEDHLARQHEE
ncbi:MAG TPA: hypothetical protein DDW19_08360 [Anaerolineaceae bacterium]|jgi:hypothetical protein|nr:hypothetical protein [Anaerolineaceae bacterium]